MINANRNSAVGYRSRGGFGPVMNVSNCVNNDYTTFANGTPTGFDATSDGAATHEAGTSDEIPYVSGQKYRVVFDCALNGGLTAPKFNLRENLAGGNISVESFQNAASGANSFDFTCIATMTGVVVFLNLSTTANYEITNLSVRLIL